MLPEILSCWCCPSCHAQLVREANRWSCVNNHSFDIAKENYVNLLLPQHKNSKSPGDSKEMVVARRNFLSQDHYLPLAERLAKIIDEEFASIAPKQNTYRILDAGCGEGYYLSQLSPILAANEPANSVFQFYGVDIAKPAVQKAAKKAINNNQFQFEFAVASSFNLPVMTKTQHAVIQIFAPSKASEIHRVLNDNGIWISVTPASEHLFELKDMVYDLPQKHVVEHTPTAEFESVSQQTLQFRIVLNTPQQRQDLLMMTPFYWTISEAKKKQLIEELTFTHAHFNIEILRKGLESL